MNNQQKQQAELRLFKHYIQDLNLVKKDLEKIKQITDIEKKYHQANVSLSGHSTKYSLSSGHYNTGKLWEISGCSSSLNEYAKLISELRTIETEAAKQLKATQCAYCKKKNLTNPYVYKEMDGYKTVFCDNGCLNKRLEKLNKLNNEQQTHTQREKESKNSSITQTARCSFCDKEGVFGKEGYPDKLFCISCIWKENPEIRNISEISEAEFNQRKLNLKSNWDCPHYEAEHDNEIANECLQWNLEQLLSNSYLPAANPVMTNQAGKKVCVYCYHSSKEYLDLYQELSTQYLSKMLPPSFSLSSNLQTNYQKLQNKSFSDVEQAAEIVEQIEKWTFSHQKEVDEAWKKEQKGKEENNQQQINIHNPSRDINFDSNNPIDISNLNNGSKNSSVVTSSIQSVDDISKQNTSNLFVYILCGIVGIGLVTLIVFIIIRIRKKD